MFWIRLKFIWNYVTHLQTDANPPLELIFKFVDTLDKKDTKQHIKIFNSLDVSKKIYNAKLPVRLLVKENEYKEGTFGAEFKKWIGDDAHIVDLFTLSLVPYRATRKKNTKFNKFAEATMLQHDLIHFFNGYDTSPMGEVCVLSFNLAKEWRKSYSTILYATLLMSMRNTLLPSKYPKGVKFYEIIKYSPIYVYIRCVLESYFRGKQSQWFLSVDWESYLDMPLKKVKEELNLKHKPKYWLTIQPIWKRLLIHYKKILKRKTKRNIKSGERNGVKYSKE